MSQAPILFYDGDCAFCAAAVAFVLKHERRRRDLLFAPLGGERGRELFAEHPELVGVDSMVVLVPDGGGSRALARSRAAFEIGRYLGGPWTALVAVASLVPRRLADWAYDGIAARRRRLLRAPTCFVPSPAQASRFLLYRELREDAG